MNLAGAPDVSMPRFADAQFASLSSSSLKEYEKLARLLMKRAMMEEDPCLLHHDS